MDAEKVMAIDTIATELGAKTVHIQDQHGAMMALIDWGHGVTPHGDFAPMTDHEARDYLRIEQAKAGLLHRTLSEVFVWSEESGRIGVVELSPSRLAGAVINDAVHVSVSPYIVHYAKTVPQAVAQARSLLRTCKGDESRVIKTANAVVDTFEGTETKE